MKQRLELAAKTAAQKLFRPERREAQNIVVISVEPNVQVAFADFLARFIPEISVSLEQSDQVSLTLPLHLSKDEKKDLELRIAVATFQARLLGNLTTETLAAYMQEELPSNIELINDLTEFPENGVFDTR